MPELVVFLAFIVALFVIEIWYVRHNELTISEHVQQLVRRLDRQLVFAFGVVVGWFIAHFTQ
jgi:hypothetical protein